METPQTRSYEDLYREGVAHTLSGFQILEEGLKGYIDLYYASVRALLGERLHFGYQLSDVQDAPLGPLITIFAKTCANQQLVSELRGVVKPRNKAAHQAFLCLYGDAARPQDLASMIDSNVELHKQLVDLLQRVHAETVKVLAALNQAANETNGRGQDA